MQSQTSPSTTLTPTLRLSPIGVAKILTGIIAFLFFLHLLGIIARLPNLQTTDSITTYWTDLVDFDSEANLPAWYSSLTLLFCAVLLAVIATSKRAAKDAYALHWMGLAVIFTFLSADELSRVHERLTFTMVTLWHLKGFIRFAWVIPGSILVITMAVAYLRFLVHLPKTTRHLLVIAGIIFVVAAIGLEMLESKVFDQYGKDNLLYLVQATIEELLEMLSVALFVYTLLDYIQRYVGKVEVEVGAKET